MKTHARYEWVTADNTGYAGDSPEQIFSQISKDEQPEDLLAWFSGQQEDGAGSWKWYDSLIGERWRFDPNRNDLVRRVGGGRGKRKNPEKVREQAKRNLQISHDKRREDHDKAVEIARKGQAALAAKQTRQDVMDRMQRMRDARAARVAAMTPEERAELGRHISEAKKAKFAERKAASEK